MMWSGLEPSEGEVYYGHYIAVLFWLALREIRERSCVFATNSNFPIPIIFQPDGVKL